MGYGNHSALVLVEVLLQPVDALSVEVVGRFVEQQHIGLFEQQAAQSHTAAFATRQVLSLLVGWWQIERCHSTVEASFKVPSVGRVENALHLSLTGEKFVHLVLVFVIFWKSKLLVDFLIFLQCIDHLLNALFHELKYGLVVVEWWVLWQIAHAVAWCPNHVALVIVVDAGNDFEQCGFTSTIQTDDADFRTIEK